MTTRSISGLSCNAPDVVLFPALLKSKQMPLKWWADGGLVYCENPNRNGAISSMFPTDALKQVTALLTPILADVKEHPSDYNVHIGTIRTFFNDFVAKVVYKAFAQDEAGGNVARTICDQFGKGLIERDQERQRALQESLQKHGPPKPLTAADLDRMKEKMEAHEKQVKEAINVETSNKG